MSSIKHLAMVIGTLFCASCLSDRNSGIRTPLPDTEVMYAAHETTPPENEENEENEVTRLNRVLMAELTLNDHEIRELRFSDQYDMMCLALNIYHEARGSSRRDQRAVGFVTLNRVRSTRYAQTICDVVWQPKQFSWTHDGKPDYPVERAAWSRAKQIAYRVWTRAVEDETDGKMHFYAVSLDEAPHWAEAAADQIQIGKHVYLTAR